MIDINLSNIDNLNISTFDKLFSNITRRFIKTIFNEINSKSKMFT